MRKRNVKYRDGLAFAIPGVVGTIIGIQLGLLTPPRSLILLFALLILVMTAKMFVNISNTKNILGSQGVHRRLIGFSDLLGPRQFNFLASHRLKLMGILIGLAAGYFGIGGGFLIVPSLLYSGLNISNAIGTSLIPVSMFGATTALGYCFANQVNIAISLLFVIGGAGGGFLGTMMLTRIRKNITINIFAILIAVVGVYIILKYFLI